MFEGIVLLATLSQLQLGGLMPRVFLMLLLLVILVISIGAYFYNLAIMDTPSNSNTLPSAGNVLITTHMQTLVTSEKITLNPWVIDYCGNLIVIKVNKLLLKDLGDGYWLIVLPDTKYNVFDDIALNQVATYLNIGEPEVVLHVVWSGKTYVVKVNETRYLSGNLEEVYKHIKEFLDDLSRRGLTPAEMKLLIKGNSTHIIVGGIGKLGVDEFAKLAHRYFKDFSKKVIVVEKLGWLPPEGPYQRIEMLNELMKVPCFFSFGEAIYGTSIIFNVTCIKELAEKNNMTFNEVVEHIVGKVKKLNTLIRKYLPWQEILIIIAKTPKLIIPVGTTLIDTSKSSSEVQIETMQTEKQPQITTTTTTYHEEEIHDTPPVNTHYATNDHNSEYYRNSRNKV